MVGVPALVPIIPVVVLLKLPATETGELMLSVVPVPTVISLLTVFVPPPEKLVVPEVALARLQKVIFPFPLPRVPPPVVVTVPEVPEQAITPVVVFVKFPAELIF